MSPSTSDMSEVQQSEQFNFVNKAREFPVVETALGSCYNLSQAIYNHTKSFSPFIAGGIDTVESSLASASAPLMRSISLYEKQLHYVDDFGVRQLEALGQKFPAMKEPTEKLYEDTYKFVDQNVIKPVGNIYDKSIVQTGVQGRVETGISTALDWSEKALDSYLPSSDNQPIDSTNDSIGTRVVKLGTTATRRISSKLPENFKSAEQLVRIQFTVDLISLAQENIGSQVDRLKITLNKAKEMWGELDLQKTTKEASEALLRERQKISATVAAYTAELQQSISNLLSAVRTEGISPQLKSGLDFTMKCISDSYLKIASFSREEALDVNANAQYVLDMAKVSMNKMHDLVELLVVYTKDNFNINLRSQTGESIEMQETSENPEPTN